MTGRAVRAVRLSRTARRLALAGGVLVAIWPVGGCGSSHGGGPQAIRVAGEYGEIATPFSAPRGTVLLLHPGAWAGEGSAAVRRLRPVAERFRRAGWRTLTVTYPNGRAGLSGVEREYDYVRRRWPAGPTCAYGQSSGGHWALLLALERPELDCVVAVAAPTDLTSWPRMARGGAATFVRTTVRRVFGADARTLTRYSPARRWPAAARARLFLVYAVGDPLVPTGQGRALVRRARRGRLFELRRGSAPWVHPDEARPPSLRGVDPRQQDAALEAILRSMRGLG